MNKPQFTPSWTIRSPWLDPASRNLFKYEFKLAQEKLSGDYYTPLEPYRWIYEHGGVPLFFKGLAHLAPMFPLRAFNGQIATWISPPPSGFGNAIYIVMGHDKTGKLRLVGGNYFSAPTQRSGDPLESSDFFAKYDALDDRRKQQLVFDTVTKSIDPDDKTLLQDISRECEHFHTMGVYITVLTSDSSIFHAAKAVIEGVRPADFSYERFGEVI